MAPVPVQEGAVAHLDVVRTEARHLLGGGPVVLAAQRHAVCMCFVFVFLVTQQLLL